MSSLFQILLSGITLGATIGLLGVAFVAMFSVTGVVNIAQGEFLALAGITASVLTAKGVPLPLALLAGVLAAVAMALLMWMGFFRWIRNLTTLTSIIITLGISIAVQAGLLLVFGPEGHRMVPFTEGGFSAAGVRVEGQQLWIILATVVAVAAVTLLYDKTRLGRALKASAVQPIAARLVGIAPMTMGLISFVLAGLLGGIAGVVLTPQTPMEWNTGLMLGLKGFVAAVLAGLTSVRGAILGGILLGILEQVVIRYVSSGFAQGVAFLVLVVALVIKPTGIFVREVQARV